MSGTCKVNYSTISIDELIENVIPHYKIKDVVDCEYWARGLNDLAVFKWAMYLREKENLWDSFLKGYSSVRYFSNYDLDVIDIFVEIREIWLIGLHLGNSNDYSKGVYDDRYIDRHLEYLKTRKSRRETNDK